MRFTALILALALALPISAAPEVAAAPDTSAAAAPAVADTAAATADTLAASEDLDEATAEAPAEEGFHNVLKQKFIEGNAGFMSLVALVLVLGLAFCIERIIYLTLSEINTRRFMTDLDRLIADDKIDEARTLAETTRGPVAAVCSLALTRTDDSLDKIELSMASYASLECANLEKGCSWITLFISIAPSLGFLGTVIGMIMAFDQIRIAGDISTSIVAEGMKVALITTVFGIIVALVLQLFYNFIVTKIEELTRHIEEASIALLDSIARYQTRQAAKQSDTGDAK